MTPLTEPRKHRTLHSWKEIAGRLGVTVRSAQRWEKLGALPVYRQGTGTKARVIAYTDELDRWVGSGGASRCERETRAGLPARLRILILLGIAAAAFVAAVALWRAGVFSGRRVPSSWMLDGSRLILFDERRRVCWEKTFPTLHADYDPDEQDAALIADVDGDGRSEVLFNLYPKDQTNVRGALFCFDDNGRLRWEFRYGAARRFGNRDFEPHFKGQFFRPVRAGVRSILTVANHQTWYPAQFALIDAATGALIEEYWHPGRIDRLVLHDIDGDGADEALFGAINNPGDGLGHAALGALKLPFSRAPRQPALPEKLRAPTPGGGELLYALFPYPDVCRVMGRLSLIHELRIDPYQRILVETSMPEGGIVYYLDFRFNVREHRFSDGFASLHELYRKQGLLDHALSAAEQAALGKVILFTSAPDGNSRELDRYWRF